MADKAHHRQSHVADLGHDGMSLALNNLYEIETACARNSKDEFGRLCMVEVAKHAREKNHVDLSRGRLHLITAHIPPFHRVQPATRFQ
jgi:hypothetical protein